MNRKKIQVALGTLVLLAVGTVVGALYWPEAAGTSTPPADLITISNRGTPAAATRGIETVMVRTQTHDGELRLLGQRADASFYVIVGTRAHGTCYAVGRGDGEEHTLNDVACAASFPSSNEPVFDGSILEQRPDGTVRFDQVKGFAVDRVSTVTLLDSGGNVVAETAVENNIYYIPRADMPARATRLEARDRGGNVVWHLNA